MLRAGKEHVSPADPCFFCTHLSFHTWDIFWGDSEQVLCAGFSEIALLGWEEIYIFAYGAIAVLVSIWVKSHFVSMFLFPFFLSPRAHMCRHTHKQDAVRGGDVACASPSSTSSESCEAGSGVHAVSWCGHTRWGLWKLQQPICNLWDPWCKTLPCTVLQHRAILYLKQPEAYVSLIFAKANTSFLYECSKWQIQAGCSAQGVRRSCGFPCLCSCASAELCVCEISAGWMVKLEAQRSDKEQCKRIQKGFGSFSWWASRWQMLLGIENEK